MLGQGKTHDRPFFDTNILVHAFSDDDRRQRIALELLLAGGVIGVQTLNELINVFTGKLRMPWSEALERTTTVRQLCEPPIPITLGTHLTGSHIARHFGYQFYDSLMLAAALEASCTVFYSEDLQNGQSIETLTIRNPFA
jgi:predicted nucleic acid-binding protein